MGRLIDADALKERIRSFLGIKSLDDLLPEEKAIVQHIDRMPTVDAVPVRHGHWKEDTGGYGFWICSHCGFVSEASGADILYRYCPHCGARMDGKDGDRHV